MTYVEITTNTPIEIMVDVDIDTGKTVDVYGYRKDLESRHPHFPDDRSEDGLWRGTWKTGENPAFKHLDRRQYDKFARVIAVRDSLFTCSDIEMLEEKVASGDYSPKVFENPIVAALRERMS